jgi:hypothetical protein
MSNYTIEVTENVVNLDVLKDHDVVIEIKSSDNFITFDTPSGYPILFTSGILPVSRVGSGYLIENLTSGNTIARTFGDQTIDGNKTFSNDIISSGNLAIKSQATSITPSYFPVFVSDPSTFSRNIYTRTSLQVKSDLVLNNVQNIALSGVNFIAGSGLVGGGNLSSSRSFDIGQGDGLIVGADSIAVDSTVVRISGEQTLYGGKTFSGTGIRITTGAIGINRKDIVLKGNTGTLFNNTVTITPTNNLYTDRTYYLPEAGFDADFVMTAGGQIITGPKTFIASTTFSSGTFQSLKLNGFDVSVSGHSHTSSNITNFNISVDSRITNANLQPSGNYSLSGHTHSSSNITDFNTSVSGLIGSSVVRLTGNQNISGIKTFSTINSDTISATINLSGPAGFQVTDDGFFFINASNNFNVDTEIGVANFYNMYLDGTNVGIGTTNPSSQLHVIGTGNFTQALQVNGTGVSISGHTHTISNITGLQTALDAKQGSGNYALSSHTHTSSNITDFNTSVDLRITNANLQPSGNYSVVDHAHTISNITGLQTALDNKQASGNYSLTGHTHNISDITSLQTTLDNKQPSGNYALTSHTHTSSNITDFNSSVSGLLPVKNVTGTGYVNISSTTGNYRVSVTGLQPAGNYASSSHTHTSSDITNFNTSVSGLVNGIYAPLSSPSFTGTPLTPTATAGTNSTQIASTAFVRTEISNLVASAPSALDTLNELATALGNDANFSTTVTNNLAGKANLSGATFTGSISGPSGNFTSLKINSVDVSANGHTHTTSNITDFDSGVSGLLPVKNISNGSYVSVSSTIGNYTISVTGLQPSGNYSLVGHTHIISDITSLQTTLDGKQALLTNPVTGTGTNNYHTKWTSSSSIGNSLIYDNGTSVGIGTSLPNAALEVSGIIRITDGAGRLQLYRGGGTVYDYTIGKESNHLAISTASDGTTFRYTQFGYHASNGTWNPKTVINNYNGAVGIGTTSPSADFHVNGSGLFASGLIISSQTANTIASFDANKNIVSLTTGTYPSLTELSYVKGLTSAIQTQIDGKAALSHTHTSSNITDFNSSVSGLLPVKNITAGTNIQVTSTTGNYIISVTGITGGSTITNYTDNRILTSDGTTTGINGESNLTFDGTLLTVNGSGNFTSLNVNGSGVGLYNTSVLSLGTLTGSNSINCGQDRQIQTLTLNGTATTFTKGTGWPSSNSVSRDITLNITAGSNTSVTWTVVTDWYRQPDSPLPSGSHIVLLRAIGSGIIQGHYIGSKTN